MSENQQNAWALALAMFVGLAFVVAVARACGVEGLA